MTGAARRDRYGSMAVVPTVSRWWRSRTDPQRIDLYTRWSFYGALLTLPLLLLSAVSGGWTVDGPVLPLVLFASSLVMTAGCLWLARQGFSARAEGAHPGLGPVAWALVPALVTVAAGLAAVHGGKPDRSGPWVVGVVAAAILVALSVSWPTSWLTWGAAAAAVGAAGAAVLDGESALSAALLAVPVGLALTTIAAAFAFTVWILEVILQMERTRGVQLQLAVAEERLRFSRDLHDVMGRNLSAIALKSQLAAQLARRGRDEAAGEMDQVSRLAESSMREVREVVRGYRAADLAAELAGARSVLRSAGVTVEVTGQDDVGAVPGPVQELLGWVVREAVTNVLRHSAADRCVIELKRGEQGFGLTVADNGLAQPARWGHGLTGLAERLAAAGGQLQADPGPDGFCVHAQVSA